MGINNSYNSSYDQVLGETIRDFHVDLLCTRSSSASTRKTHDPNKWQHIQGNFFDYPCHKKHLAPGLYRQNSDWCALDEPPRCSSYIFLRNPQQTIGFQLDIPRVGEMGAGLIRNQS